MVFPNTNANLTWSSSGTACTATGGWSGAKAASGIETVGPITQNTTFGISCTSNGSAAATSSVTIAAWTQAPAPAPTASKVTSDFAGTTLDFYRLGIHIRDITWDSTHSLFYAVTWPDSSIAPSSLISIDPVTRATVVRSLPQDPWCVAVTADGALLYVGYKTNGLIERFSAAGFIRDLSFNSGNANSWVWQIVPSPTASHTFAASVSDRGTIAGEPNGIFIADDAVIRPNSLHGYIVSSGGVTLQLFTVGDIEWTPDAARIYAVLRSSGRGVVDLPVTAQGVTIARYLPWPLEAEVELHGNKIYSRDGRVFVIDGDIQQLGQAATPGGDHWWMLSKGKVFSSDLHRNGGFQDGTTIWSGNPDTFIPIDSITFNGAALVAPEKILPWGTDGLAIANATELVIAHGTFAAAGGIPAAWPATLPVVYNTSRPNSGELTGVRVLSLGARDIVANPCGDLFVSIGDYSLVRPNSILQVNLADATIKKSGFAGGDPFVLAASDDCTTIYAGRRYSDSVARLRTSDMTITGELPMGSAPIGFLRARAMSVAPSQAQTVAITRGDMDQTLCGGSDGPMIIFDGATPRAIKGITDGVWGYKSLAWGANASILYAESWGNTYSFAVDASGVGMSTPIVPYRIGTSVYDLGRDLHFDRARNRVLNSFGYIYDVAAGAELPRLTFDIAPSIWNGCGTPGQTITTDPTSGRIYWTTKGNDNRIIITAYAADTRAPLGSLSIDGPGSIGLPYRAVRVGTNTLAVVTDEGYVALVQGALMGP
ncbi:MAG TPA: hypothetical protein VGO61_21000 [Steroidobacteraceae bacterium]|jgi:hypothetical protein|nr:hypothetical protein [Steroidobacteraceae bacterium]